MELELTRIHFEATVYDVRKAIAKALQDLNLEDPHGKENEAEKLSFEVIMGKGSSGRIHNGKAILCLVTKLGAQLLRWYSKSEEHKITVNGRPVRLSGSDSPASLDVKQVPEKAPYVYPEQEDILAEIKDRDGRAGMRVSKVQFGVLYQPSNSPGTERSFSVEYERDFLDEGVANLYVVHDHKLIRIQVSCRDQMAA
jgi:RNA-dependent RNA polymerase